MSALSCTGRFFFLTPPPLLPVLLLFLLPPPLLFALLHHLMVNTELLKCHSLQHDAHPHSFLAPLVHPIMLNGALLWLRR
jgi:hypothetical protein